MSATGTPDASSPQIRLYTQAINPFAEKVAAALKLKALSFERVESDDPEDIRRWSPISHTLPVLEIDGRRRAESIRIVDWIDTLHPEPPLFSRDPRTAERQRSLASWSDDSFAWYWNRWRAARYPQPGDESPPDESLFALLKHGLGRRLGTRPASRAQARELVIVEEIEDRLDDLVGFLGERPYFYSETPSIADLAVYAMLRVLRYGPIPHTARAIDARDPLTAFLDRLDQRIASSAASATGAPSPADRSETRA